MQLSFFFEENVIILTDKDGEKIAFNRYTDKTKTIKNFLHCTNEKANEVLCELEKEYDVITCSDYQIILSKNNLIIYNFEIGGETVYKGHKYNPVNEWDFRDFVEKGKIKKETKKRKKDIELTLTERQLSKAKQLNYASEIGFDIGYNDYALWHIV